ncbi:hypothetical protein [Thiofaba sp. EF100]|uniref:hypothetical protein n=1 Tax=Thiofaba sp. EF100 TaxID=3121274 RepID=UPI003221BB1C
MAALTLFVPGLLGPWSAEANPPQPHAPALRRMLARGDRLPVELLGFEGALARLFGHQGEDLPWAALGLWGETGQRPEGFVLRLDPVHLKLGMTDAIVFGGPSLRLSMDEAQALAASVEAHFSELGWRLTVAAPERWYLQAPQAFDLVTTPLTRALRRDAGLFKPGGADAPRWLAWLTEIQMLLHAHPVNEAREARGLPIINHLWPWGAGSIQGLPADFTLTPSPSPIKGEGGMVVFANHPLARGLALASGLPLHEVPETFAELPLPPSGDVLVVLDEALWPWLSGDMEDWQATVEGLEARWFAPVWRKLVWRGVESSVLEFATHQRWILKPIHRWRVWRRTGRV